MFRHVCLIAALLLTACGPAPQSSTQPSASPSATPTANPAASSTPSTGGVSYSSLSLKLNGKDALVESSGILNAVGDVITVNIGLPAGGLLAKGRQTIGLTIGTRDEARISPDMVSLTVNSGTGGALPVVYQTMFAGTPELFTVKASGGKLELHFKGKMKCGVCSSEAGAPPQEAAVVLDVTGLQIK